MMFASVLVADICEKNVQLLSDFLSVEVSLQVRATRPDELAT